MVEKYLVLRKVSRLQYLVLCLNFAPLARAFVQQGGALTSSRVTPDSLLPFVHPLLSQVYIYSYLDLPRGVQWRSTSSVGASIGDRLESAGYIYIIYIHSL